MDSAKATDRESNMRIFLAGASGVIGRRLCPLLIQDGWYVMGTTRSTNMASALRAIGVAPVVVDVFDAEALVNCVAKAKPNVVVHQLTDLSLGLDPAKMCEALVRNARIREIGTSNLLKAATAAGAKRVVAQSIAFAYAPGPMPYREESALNIEDSGFAGLTARAVASLEQQVLETPLEGVVLRYGKLYGPGTGFEDPPSGGGPVHVDAAADAARRAIVCGNGTYNIAEEDGTVSCDRARAELGWSSDYRMDWP